MGKFLKVWTRLSEHDDGVTSMEYALLGVLIAMVCISAVMTVGTPRRNVSTLC